MREAATLRVGEPASKILKTEFVCRESFLTLHGLQARLNDYVHWHSHFKLHSEPDYVIPAELMNAGLSL